MKVTIATLAAGLMIGTAANAAFIYHDSATTTGGEFSGSFPIENLKDAGHTSSTDTENTSASGVSYATTNPATGGFPVTITLEFDNATDLSKFYLWNHANNNAGETNGAGSFSLTFYTGAGATGSQIGSVYNNEAVATTSADNADFQAQVFDFGGTYAGVRSVELEITDKVNDATSGFVAIRELGFEQIPEPSSLALMALGGLLIARRRRG